MAISFAGALKIAASGTLISTSDLTTDTSVLNYSKSYTITNGSGVDSANMCWADTRTLTASSTENLDLAGVLTNAFGTAITFTSIKGIIVSAAAGNTNNVLVGGGTAGFINWVGDVTDIINIRPGGCFVLMSNDATGYVVTATTADILKIANSSSGTSVTYDIILIGVV